MVLCFQCSVDTKRQFDELLRTGRYSDLSELITVALSNQVMLHEYVGRDGRLQLPPQPSSTPELRPAVEDAPSEESGPLASDLSRRWLNGVSALFTNRPASPGGPIAELPEDPAADRGEVVPPSRWIFGQYNRLLPAKASCRALANLLVDGRGIDATGVAKKIAGEAMELGNYLRILDRRYERSRDEMFCTAFPGPANPDKGRLRYANQFVASVDKQGSLSGLLFELKFINRMSGREPRISLTDAGWRFASMESPVLDSEDESNVRERLSSEERSFLLTHILSCVPRERYAYQLILSAISQGQNTPESISEVMKGLEVGLQDSDSLLATQRSGAISRMSDLALLSRERDGIRVRYNLTEDGSRFLRSR